jgi:hypothetical protein
MDQPYKVLCTPDTENKATITCGMTAIGLGQVPDVLFFHGFEVVKRCEPFDLDTIPCSLGIKSNPGECQFHGIDAWSIRHINHFFNSWDHLIHT